MAGTSLSEQGSDLLDKSRELFEKGRKVADDAAELFEKGRSMVKRLIAASG